MYGFYLSEEKAKALSEAMQKVDQLLQDNAVSFSSIGMAEEAGRNTNVSEGVKDLVAWIDEKRK